MAQLVNGLVSLRAEFDTVNPHRDRSSDGWIGDAHHALTISDHNPDAAGNVRAIDVDVDGVPMAKIVAFMVARCKAGKERRLHYVIFRRTIWSSSWGWTPRRYLGLNPHTKHAHFSASPDLALARTAGAWGIAAEFGPQSREEAAHAPKPARPSTHAAGSRRLVLRDPALSGDDVRFVQRWIGDRCGPADGQYGPKTVAGVRWYQRMRGLAADGIVGPATWRNMGVRYSETKQG
jgi:hypothetical protein